MMRHSALTVMLALCAGFAAASLTWIAVWQIPFAAAIISAFLVRFLRETRA